MASTVTSETRIAIARLRARRTGVRRTLVRPATRLTIARGGRLDVTGALDLGPAWERGRHYRSQMIVGAGATVRVTGRMTVHTNFRIWVNDGALLIMGSGFSNYGLNLSCWERIEIGDGCALGENVTLRDSNEHDLTGSTRSAPILIGDHVWIASNVTILPGVTIHDGGVIASGAVVTHEVPARCLVAGVPAIVIREDVDWV